MDIISDNYNQDIEVGFNVLNGNQNLIIYPELKFKRKDLFFINTNKPLIDKINKKENLSNKDVVQIPNTGKRNCFFKTLSQFYFNEESYHIYYRKIICEYINTIKANEAIEFPYRS